MVDLSGLRESIHGLERTLLSVGKMEVQKYERILHLFHLWRMVERDEGSNQEFKEYMHYLEQEVFQTLVNKQSFVEGMEKIVSRQ